MKIRLYYITYCLGLILACTQCAPTLKPRYKEIKLENLIHSSFEFNSIKCEQISSEAIIIKYDEINLKRSDEELKQIRNKYNDNNWGITVKFDTVYEPLTCIAAPFCDLTSINITTTNLFNSSHPANSSLNDIVNFISVSPLKFIESNYTKPFFINNESSHIFRTLYLKSLEFSSQSLYVGYFKDTFDKTATPFYPIEKMVNEITSKDLTLLAPTHPFDYTLGYLYFTQTPDTPGDYEITVEMVGDNGKTYKTTTIMTFE